MEHWVSTPPPSSPFQGLQFCVWFDFVDFDWTAAYVPFIVLNMQCVPYLFYPLLRVNTHSSTCIICYINMAEILPIRLKTLSNQSSNMLISFGYFVPLDIFFHSYRDVTITCTSEGLQFDRCSWQLSTEGFLVCHSRALSIGAVATCFNDLCLSRCEFEHPTFCMQSERSNWSPTRLIQ